MGFAPDSRRILEVMSEPERPPIRERGSSHAPFILGYRVVEPAVYRGMPGQLQRFQDWEVAIPYQACVHATNSRRSSISQAGVLQSIPTSD